MGKFKLTASRLLIPPRPHTSAYNGDTLHWSGMVRSERGLPGSHVFPVWSLHGNVEARPMEFGWLLGWVDEGTVASLVPVSPTRCLFKLGEVSMGEVMAAQDRWQRFKGLTGRDDPEDELRHAGWRVWAEGDGTYKATAATLSFKVSGNYGMR